MKRNAQKPICGIICGICFLLMIGFTGGLELGSITIKQWIIYELIVIFIGIIPFANIID